MGYPRIEVHNPTAYVYNGYYKQRSAFCKNHGIGCNAHSIAYGAEHRGICLLTEISGQLTIDGEAVQIGHYNSSGTSYSRFIITKRVDGTYFINRIVSAEEADELTQADAEAQANAEEAEEKADSAGA